MRRSLVLAPLLLASACSAAAPSPTPAADPDAGAKPSPAATETPADPAPTAVEPAPMVVDTQRLEALLRAHPETFELALSDPEGFRIQIIVTTFDPPAEYRYRADAEYVFPASSIKTFAAVAALRKLAALQADGHPVDLHTPLAWCDGASCDEIEDPSNLDGGTITLGHEIRKMQLVSNNGAFNRLYEFVGHRELNEDVWRLGFPDVRIQHRMYGSRKEKVRRATPRIEMRPPSGSPIVIPARNSDLVLPPTPISGLDVADSHRDHAGRPREGPMNFGHKNHAALGDLHRLTLALNRPGDPNVSDLGLSEEHRAFLLAAMTEDPLASRNPVYTAKKKHLRYKLLIRGIMRVIELDRIRYTGKPGRAFGFHSDSAFIEDTRSGRAIAVSAVVHANQNGVVGDDVYIYDELSRPFFKDLGEVLAREFLVESR